MRVQNISNVSAQPVNKDFSAVINPIKVQPVRINTARDKFESSKLVGKTLDISYATPTIQTKTENLKNLQMDEKSISTAKRNNLDLEKLSKMIKSMSTDKTTKAVVAESPFDKKNNFLVMVNTASNALKMNLVDAKLDVLAKEEKTVFKKDKTEMVGGRPSSAYSINKTVDYRSNTTS